MDNACIYDMVTVYFLPWKKLMTQAIVFPVIIVIIKCLADIYFWLTPKPHVGDYTGCAIP